MLVWKSLANRCNSFMFFAVEQGKTSEKVDCSWRGGLGKGRQVNRGRRCVHVTLSKTRGICREHIRPLFTRTRLLGMVAGPGQGIGAFPCAASSIAIAFSL